MIVSCPACNVHYQQVPPPVVAVLARCSRCDETFDVEPEKAPYRLVPVVHAPAFEPRPDVAVDVPPPPTVDADPFDLGPAEAVQAEEEADTTEEVAACEDVKGSRLSMYGVGLGMLLAGVATVSGYYLSLLGYTDTVTGTGGGAAVGLVLALAAIRWTMRDR